MQQNIDAGEAVDDTKLFLKDRLDVPPAKGADAILGEWPSLYPLTKSLDCLIE